jgi:hypothetical protein
VKALFRAVDNTHTAPDTSERCCYKKGDFVVVMPDGHQWGAKECPPHFVTVSCPEVTVEQARQYLDSWDLRPDYEILASNEQGWRVRVTSELPGALNEAGIPIATARTYLEGQGCQFVSSAADNIVVDIPKAADIEEIKEKLGNVIGRPHRRKRWCVSEACIDWVLTQGGVDVPVTQAQLQTYLTDKAS